MTIRIRRATALLCAALSSGCYKFVASDLASVRPETYVHIFLTRKGLNEIPAGIPTSTTYISGRVTRQSADSVLIRVPVSLSIQGNGAKDLAQNLFVPVGEIVAVESRQFSGGRTFLAAAGAVGIAAVTVIGVGNAGTVSQTDKTSANPN